MSGSRLTFRIRVVDHLSPTVRRLRWALWWLRVRVWISHAWDTLLLLLAIGCCVIGVVELLRRIIEARSCCP
jgi:hypothetical protein